MPAAKTYLIGAGIAVAIAVALVAAAMRHSSPAGTRNDGYAAEVTISNAQVSAAESMMAGGVVYYTGTIENHGDRTLTGYTVALTFKGIDGNVLERDERSLVDDRFRPVPPHGSRSFEIGFDRVPAGWNQAPPDPQAVSVWTR
ncbi:MAG TPA: FxLYD domain-containing protein [Terriglobales bacterium]|nr:FxLYD domain-containing protein [Terriglobales bacterium]